MSTTYKTSQLASMFDVHPNTIRMYEKINFISKAKRLPNGYRVFTNSHVYQLKIVRAALQVEIVQNGLRKKTINIIRSVAANNIEEALSLTKEYLSMINSEYTNAEEAISIVNNILNGTPQTNTITMKRKEVSKYLNISMDTLRNWELNGLLQVKRKENGYRVYTDTDIQRLKIIHALRCANYSLASILRMLSAISNDPDINIKDVIDTPEEDEDIVSACDKLLTSLAAAKENALYMEDILNQMKLLFK
ncbi:MAG: MerR family transcriptional regulator [Coprobacillaceae bacterium]